MINRRGFLSLFGAAAATAAIDPERLLWVPGAKVISVPRVIRIDRSMRLGDTLFVRIPMRFTARQGPAYYPESITENRMAVTITPENMDYWSRAIILNL